MNKTVPNDRSVADFIASVDDTQQQEDSKKLVAMMQEVSGQPPVMWGPSIIGFGSYHYRYASGREGDYARIGFSPRKGMLSVYASCDITPFKEALEAMGPHKTGKACIYIKRLADIDEAKLRGILQRAYEATGDIYIG